MNIATARLRGAPQPRRVEIDQRGERVRIDGRWRSGAEVPWDVPTSGCVYGALFNFNGALDLLGDAVRKPPYLAAPKAPVLYIKPANTWIGHGMPIPMPDEAQALRMGGAVGIVIGRQASRVSAARARDYIGGYTVVNDVSVPHDNFYRPAIREQCRDGFCPIGPWVAASEHVADPAALLVRTFVNGKLALERSLRDLARPVPQLLADITAFMTLYEGDVLVPAVAEDAPLARVGDRVAVEVDAVGRLENPILAEADVLAGAVQ